MTVSCGPLSEAAVLLMRKKNVLQDRIPSVPVLCTLYICSSQTLDMAPSKNVATVALWKVLL